MRYIFRFQEPKEAQTMPVMRKLPPEEVQVLENKGKGTRKLVEEEYDRYLADYDVGEYAEAMLGEEENRFTARNRFKAAARRRGVGLAFRRTSNNLLRFQIVASNGDGQLVEETPPPAPEPPPKRKGGRPRKNT
jgi:hypothetical protein